ncbi:MAG TPA: pseudouridine-5'-phosphate glycosidase [Longimicrobium sp.]
MQQAQESGNGVVALESTVIAHGLPHPRNLEVARSLEEEVSGYGAVPATVGVVRGKAIVGLAPDEIARLGTAAGVLKLSTRDLPVALARGLDGATTVASTMWLAHHAGVAVFATGGIGGVHRGDGTDVSADLTELGRTPMIVVCAGAKAILDLAATREALETAGVLVVGFGTDELPGFYSRESGLPVDVRADTPDDVAALWQAHRKLGAPGSLLLCAPPPADTALPTHAVEGAIRQALAQADARGIRGKEVTPFLLSAVAEQTGGKSLEANVALLRNNARIAAQVATALAQARWER